MINKTQYETAMKFMTKYNSCTKTTTATALLLAGSVMVHSNEHSNEITNIQFDTAANMLAYTELELSGEPLAESLGLDLDVLDPDERDQPTAFDYITGIESYEFSEEAMYELNYRSGLGPNLVHGLRNDKRTEKEIEKSAALQTYLGQLAEAVAYPKSEIPKNLNLISLPYRSGTPEFIAKVDVQPIAKEVIEVFKPNGDIAEITTSIPAYSKDYQSLKWVTDKNNQIIEPAAIGALLLKEVMWSQDFLGGMHTSDTDEEVEADSSKMDHDKKYSLGVSALDGMNGLILTELSLEKMQYLQQSLGFNGKKLGQIITPDYDPSDSAIWFPHEVQVTTETIKKNDQETQKISSMNIVDGSSQLRDQWLLLWPLSEYFAFSDQRISNQSQNPGFAAVFDGQPFASTPKKNADKSSTNDVLANDAFSMASNLSNVVFKNLQALHFDKGFGTFVDEYNKGQNKNQQSLVTTYDAAYSMVALSIFQRAQDALPVGYASASQNTSELKTPQGKAALSLIEQQADFILNHVMQKNGLVADSALLKLTQDNAGKGTNATSATEVKQNKGASIDTQFAVIRGLTAAFLATEKESYRTAARDLYLAVEKHYYDSDINTWMSADKTVYSPWTVAAISAAMREAMLHLKNNETETAAKFVPLELSQLTKRYVDWFRVVVSGREGQPGLQLAEPLADTGEHILESSENASKAADSSGDSDGDGILRIQAAGGQFGRASVLANELVLSREK